MSGIQELIRSEEDGSISFGDYTLEKKTKLDGYKHQGDIYKVKTFNEITRLEKNDTFLYESAPGTAVYSLKYTDSGVSFKVEGFKDIQLTLDLKEAAEYEILTNGFSKGAMKTSMSGKLTFGVELDERVPVEVEVKQLV